MDINFDICPICSESKITKQIIYNQIKELNLSVEANVCSGCGEKYYMKNILDELQTATKLVITAINYLFDEGSHSIGIPIEYKEHYCPITEVTYAKCSLIACRINDDVQGDPSDVIVYEKDNKSYYCWNPYHN